MAPKIERQQLPDSLATFKNAWGAVITSRKVAFLRTLAGERHFTVHEIHGQPGFLLGINAGLHGAEETSVVAALDICKEAAGEVSHGSVVGLPSANPDSVSVGVRGVPYVVRGEDSDLNRVVLQNPRSLIERHAHAIFEVFQSAYAANVKKCRALGSNRLPYPGLILDLHTESGGGGSNSEDVIPYARVDHTDDDDLLGFLIYMCEVLGISWVIEYPRKIYKEAGLDNSLSAVLVQQRIPALTVELGPEGRSDSKFVAIGRAIAHQIFGHFRMRARDHQENEEMVGNWGEDPAVVVEQVKKINHGVGPLQIADAYCVDANGAELMNLGFLQTVIKPGDHVQKGQLIGNLIDPNRLKDYLTPVYAPFASWVLSVSGSPDVRHQPGQLAYQAAVPLQDERITRIYAEQKRQAGIYSD